MSDNTIKWIGVEKITVADVPGYYCLGYNSQWREPKIRAGFCYTSFRERHFRLIGGHDMTLGPTHIAALPDGPSGE